MAFELIEHVFNFPEFIKDVSDLLDTNGIFYFSCPNGKSIPMSEGCDDNLSFMQLSFSPPMHINEFSPSNVTLFSYIYNFNITEGSFDDEETLGQISGGNITINKNNSTNEAYLNLFTLSTTQHGKNIPIELSINAFVLSMN